MTGGDEEVEDLERHWVVINRNSSEQTKLITHLDPHIYALCFNINGGLGTLGGGGGLVHDGFSWYFTDSVFS